MDLYTALPPELFEIIDCTIAVTAFIAWILCVRYLATQVVRAHKDKDKSIAYVFRAVVKLRLAVAMLVCLTGEWPRVTWLWLARYLTNTGEDAAWMATVPWVFVPIVFSAISAVGFACVVRAITPEAWGRYGNTISLGIAAVVVLLTQYFR